MTNPQGTDTVAVRYGRNPGAPVRHSTAVVVLSVGVALLTVVAAAVGLLVGGGSGPVPFTTVRGETVMLFGQGLYRYDTVFAGAGQRGTDVVVLTLGVPLLLAAALRYRRGSSRAGLLLLGTHVFFLYVYGSAALGTVAYNRLFPVYVVLFSAGLFAVAGLVAAVDPAALADRADNAPRRAPGAFLLLSGAVTLLVWGLPVVTAAVRGSTTDRLDSYATDVTYALDLGVITPAALLAGVLILRRVPTGYLLALSLLVLEAMLAPLIAAQTVSQLAAGVAFTPAEIAGPMAGFVVIAGAAGWFLVGLLRSLGTGPPTDQAIRPPQQDDAGVVGAQCHA
jgi:hypothetical protein